MQEPQTPTPAPASPGRKALLARLGKRAGLIAFFFFLGKGLLWLIVPTALAWAASR